MVHTSRHRSRSSSFAGSSRSRSRSRSASRSMRGGEADIESSNKLLLQDAASTPPLQGGRRHRSRRHRKHGGASHSRTSKRSRSRSASRSRSRQGGFGELGLAATIKEALVPFGLFAWQKRTQRRSRK